MILFAILSILQALDIYTTWKVITKHGGYERNKILAKLFNTFGLLPTLVVAKAIFLGFVYLYAMDLTALLVAMCGFYVWVVWHNFKAMK